jgi:hypothetical protein
VRVAPKSAVATLLGNRDQHGLSKLSSDCLVKVDVVLGEPDHLTAKAIEEPGACGVKELRFP